jgi:dTDP-4-amino-4,6-dideoxygalactose transaminase
MITKDTGTPAAGSPWPYFAPEEIAAATRVLVSGKVNYWTGEEGRLFEKEFAEVTKCKHGVTLSNGTVALETALHALNVGPGDEVITSSRTFIASASCAVVLGARPVFADVDHESQNLSAATIRPMITSRTKAIIAVHLAGWPCDMDEIMALAHEHGLKVVEDCAQAQGATYHGRPVGSLGDVAAFSFCQDKIMSTGGEGGMLTTNDSELWERAWSYKDHGKGYDAVYHRPHPVGFRWLHESIGTNGRMTEMQSAIGRISLKRVPGWVKTRRLHASILDESLGELKGLRIPAPAVGLYHAYYKYYAFVRPEMLAPGWNRNRILDALHNQGVRCFVGSCSEIYREKAFCSRYDDQERLPVARELGETSLMFEVHPTLSESQIRSMCRSIESVMASASIPGAASSSQSRNRELVEQSR